MNVYDSIGCSDELVPEGYPIVKLTLDGTLKSDLDWSEQKEAAWQYIEQGLRLFWEVDLGIVSRLTHSLSNESQRMSLQLSLEHFLKTMWSEFSEHSEGVSLYRGSYDFSKGMIWDEALKENFKEWALTFFPNKPLSFFEETELASAIEPFLQLFAPM